MSDVTTMHDLSSKYAQMFEKEFEDENEKGGIMELLMAIAENQQEAKVFFTEKQVKLAVISVAAGSLGANIDENIESVD